jgi:AcrR family transcriptional regulator
LRIHGTAVTTAQIAMAAGIAEGTLFRVFPDKDTLIQAAIGTAFDPGPAEREIARIEPGLGLREQLIATVAILQHRVEGVWQLMSMLGLTGPPAGRPIAATGHALAVRQWPTPDPLLLRIAEMFEPYRAELRCDPAQAARLLRMMAFAGTHPRIADGTPLTAAEIVAVVLDGIRIRSDLDTDVEVAAC